MNITPFFCRCGEKPLVDATSVYETRVRCPKCGIQCIGPDHFSATIAWNVRISKYKSNIKNLEPSEDD